jgi:hypothetical protein
VQGLQTRPPDLAAAPRRKHFSQWGAVVGEHHDLTLAQFVGKGGQLGMFGQLDGCHGSTWQVSCHQSAPVEARFPCSIGQDKPVMICRPVCSGTVEERIQAM